MSDKDELTKASLSSFEERAVRNIVLQEDTVSILILHDEDTFMKLHVGGSESAFLQMVISSLMATISTARLALTEPVVASGRGAVNFYQNIIRESADSIYGSLATVKFAPFTAPGPLLFGGYLHTQMGDKKIALERLNRSLYDFGRFRIANIMELNNGLSLFRVERFKCWDRFVPSTILH